MSKLKSMLFSAFEKVCKPFWGTGIGNIPAVFAVFNFLFQLLWSNKTVIEIQGSKMYVNPDKLPKSFIRTFQRYILFGGLEALTTEMFKKVVQEGDFVVDLGANIGYYTLLAARLVGRKGKVYAFEPEPINYRLLLKNIELNGYDNIVAMQKAVSNVAGKIRLFLDNKATGAHTIYQSDDGGKFIEVESVTLDGFLKEENHPINVIKMDIEGAEMAAFSGMDKVIRDNENLKMFVEFYPLTIRRAGNSPQEFARKLLEDYCFSVLAMDVSTKKERCLTINSISELMNFCKGRKNENLFLERKWLEKGNRKFIMGRQV